MIKTTRAQREALFRIFQRSFPGWLSPGKRYSGKHCSTCTCYEQIISVPTLQYRRFRKNVEGYCGGSGCIMVKYAGMWLGIEPDGYTHS